MKIVLTNDDGIDAPGMEALWMAAQEFGEVVVVAPDRHLSGCSHQATTSGAIEVQECGPHRFAIVGTPVDCVRLALFHLVPDADVVLSGVNEGGNLGSDIWFSGTVAAAREAAFFDRQAIAISQYRKGRGKAFPIERAAQWTKVVLAQLLREPAQRQSFWNVNFPDPPELDGECPAIVPCHADYYPLPVAYEMRDGAYHYCGNYHQRERSPGSDVATCFGGAISLTRVTLPQ